MTLTDNRPLRSESTSVDLVEGVNLNGENRQALQLAGICVRRGCGKPSADGSDYCVRHGKDQRKYHSDYMARRRELWDASDWCTNCGDPARAPKSKWCASCLIRRERTGVKVDGENKRDRVAANTTERTTASNLGRTHYHGHGKRGRVSSAQLDAGDFDDATKYLARAQAGMVYATSPEIAELGRVQRDEARNAALSLCGRALRHIAEVLHRHRVDVGELVETVGED